MRKFGLPGVAMLIALTTGCTWVGLSDEGEAVRIVANSEVNDCQRVGNTKARVPRKVWFVSRPESAVSQELETLARNEGAKLGGNTVTPMSRQKNGERRYAVYVCGD